MTLTEIYELIENSSVANDDRSREYIALGACLAAHPRVEDGLAAYIEPEDLERIGEAPSHQLSFETALRLVQSYD